MTPFLEELAARRRFGMKPGLETIRALCDALGNPQCSFKAIHVAGTNGKGAVCAILDAALREGIRDRGSGVGVGRYTSPHLVKINERFFHDTLSSSDDLLGEGHSDPQRIPQFIIAHTFHISLQHDFRSLRDEWMFFGCWEYIDRFLFIKGAFNRRIIYGCRLRHLRNSRDIRFVRKFL